MSSRGPKSCSRRFSSTLECDRTELLLLGRNATEIGEMGREVARLRTAEVEKLLGACAPMCALRESIRRVAPTDKRVLILGESGTGKELVACALHRLSARAAEPFIQVNCAAIPDELIEAELFGAAVGAYTGAVSTREGRFAAADRGTLFLDEIGELNAPAHFVRKAAPKCRDGVIGWLECEG